MAGILCNLTNHDGDPGEPCVVKLDNANSMLEEFEGTRKMAGVLGDSACGLVIEQDGATMTPAPALSATPGLTASELLRIGRAFVQMLTGHGTDVGALSAVIWDAFRAGSQLLTLYNVAERLRFGGTDDAYCAQPNSTCFDHLHPDSP